MLDIYQICAGYLTRPHAVRLGVLFRTSSLFCSGNLSALYPTHSFLFCCGRCSVRLHSLQSVMRESPQLSEAQRQHRVIVNASTAGPTPEQRKGAGPEVKRVQGPRLDTIHIGSMPLVRWGSAQDLRAPSMPAWHGDQPTHCGLKSFDSFLTHL